MLESVIFYILAAATVGLALVVVTRTNPVASAVALVGVLLGSACLFGVLSASLAAILQVLVYAGGIMVLVLFVLMLVNLHPDELKPLAAHRPFLALTVAAVLGGALLPVLATLAAAPGPWRDAFPLVEAAFGGVRGTAERLFADALLAFEALSLLLTAAVVGALVLAKRRL
jgi:NADH-quinone oxidoreductase subunit J